MRICFVCQGNIIRSPLAENLLRDLLARDEKDGLYQLDSAGTSAYHVGEPPDSRMRQVAKRHGLNYSGRARQFRKEDLDQFDLILAMDQANHRLLTQMAQDQDQQGKLRLMREFDPLASGNMDVPDPYYGGPDGFERTYEIVERSVKGLHQALEGGLDKS